MSDTIEIDGEAIHLDQILSAEVRCDPEERPWSPLDGGLRRMKQGPVIVATATLKDGRVLTEVKDNPNYEWE